MAAFRAAFSLGAKNIDVLSRMTSCKNLIGTRGWAHDDLVDVNVVRLLNRESDRAADCVRWNGNPAKFLHDFAGAVPLER